MPKAGDEMRTYCRENFTATANSMESAACFALPMPARQAAKVSVPASVIAETAERRMRRTRVAASFAEREE